MCVHIYMHDFTRATFQEGFISYVGPFLGYRTPITLFTHLY